MLPDFQAKASLVFALVALGLLLLALEIARPCFFLHDDNATWFAGAYAHDFRVLTETGRLAKVNYYQYGGEPFLEQGQTAVLYPPVYLGEALARLIPGDLRWGIEWIAALHLTLGVAGFYFWMRQLDVDRPLAALGGLAWALNPFVLILGASWIMVTYVAAWLPWLFWAIDRLFAEPWPSPWRSVALGSIAGLFTLQGYIQWVVYALLFGGLYAFYLLATGRDPLRPITRLLAQREPPWLVAIACLMAAAMVFAAWALPLLLAMRVAANASAARAEPISLDQVLFYRVQLGDLFAAQFGVFRPGFMFGLSTALFFCPALLLAPFAGICFFRSDAMLRRRLFPLMVLAVIALVLSGVGHILLNLLPFIQKFRWPFKVFLFVEFFSLAAFVQSLASLGSRRNFFGAAALAFVLVIQFTVALAQHDTNFISKTTLPTSANSLPAGMDLALGRVVAIDDHLPELDSSRYFTHAYGTYFKVPSLGGYNPLVSRSRLQFALGLDFPNVFNAPITPDVRAQLEARAVRYWIVDPASPRRAEVDALDGLRLLAAEPDRLIYEDTRAQPMAFAASAPATPLPLRYSGNSVLLQLDHVTSSVEISLGPTDGWRYCIDGGPWLRPDYRDDRVVVPVTTSAQTLEITYVDPSLNRTRELTILGGVGLSLAALGYFRHRVLRPAPERLGT